MRFIHVIKLVGAKFASTTKNEFLPCANFALPMKIVRKEPIGSILEHTATDCRKPHGGKRHHGQSGSEFDKPEELRINYENSIRKNLLS